MREPRPGWQALIGSRPVIVTLALAAVFVVYALVSDWTAKRKLTDAEIVTAQERSGNASKIDLRFVLRFEPEQFHFVVFQDAGRMVGVENRDVLMRAITVEEARAIGGNYWVADVLPLDAQ